MGAGLAGPANIARYGDSAIESIINAVIGALSDAGLPTQESLAHAHVAAGLAGAQVASAQYLLHKWQHPFADFCFTTDLEAACVGAHGGQDGAVLIVGTGSCSAAIANGQFYQFGGHGFTLGDKGSGAWLGRQAVTYTLEALDGLHAQDTLTTKIQAYYECYNTLNYVDRLNQAPPSDFAAIAPLIISAARAQTPSALSIVTDGANYLSEIARLALAKSDSSLVLVGGVATSLLEWLAPEVRACIKQPDFGPEWGAVHYLKQRRQQ